MLFVHNNVSFLKCIFSRKSNTQKCCTLLCSKLYFDVQNARHFRLRSLLFNTIENISCKLKHTLNPDRLLQNVSLPRVTP